MSEFKKTLEDIIPYLKAEERSFQSNYLDKDSYTTRLLNSDPRVPNPAQKDDTTFKHGFRKYIPFVNCSFECYLFIK